MSIKSKRSLLNSYPRTMGNPRQNFIAYNRQQRDEYVKRWNGFLNVYISVYTFPSIERKKNEYGKFEIHHGKPTLDRVFFDLDETWLKDIHKIYYWCKEYDIKFWKQMSGNGTQCIILTNRPENEEAIGNFQRWLGNKLDINIDKKIIGDTSRIFRYPNTHNIKSRYNKRFCIPVPSSAIENNMNEEWFYSQAKTQHKDWSGWSGSKLLDLDQWDTTDHLYCDYSYVEIELDEIDESIVLEFPDYPPCIQQLMSTPDLRDEGKWYYALFLKEFTYFDANQILGIMKRTISEMEWNHWTGTQRLRNHDGHRLVRFKTLMRKNYFFPSCVQFKKMGYCPQDCGRFNPAYD